MKSGGRKLRGKSADNRRPQGLQQGADQSGAEHRADLDRLLFVGKIRQSAIVRKIDQRQNSRLSAGAGHRQKSGANDAGHQQKLGFDSAAGFAVGVATGSWPFRFKTKMKSDRVREPAGQIGSGYGCNPSLKFCNKICFSVMLGSEGV